MFGKSAAYSGKHSVKTIGVGFFQKIGFHAVAGGAERRTADADAEYVGKTLAFLGLYLAAMRVMGKLKDRFSGILDLTANLRQGGK